MRILGLDISKKASGYALFEGTELKYYGTLRNDKLVTSYADGKYPWNYVEAALVTARNLLELVHKYQPNQVVIEEINLGKSRYSQRVLEFCHLAFLTALQKDFPTLEVVYLDSSAWRSALELRLDKAQKKNNESLRKARALAKKYEGEGLSATKALAKAKKELGVKGKIGKKHLAVNHVRDTYKLDVKMANNDFCDAICLVQALLTGANRCDGT